jgi:EmrB/QacA subfamily drug resistance transporter
VTSSTIQERPRAHMSVTFAVLATSVGAFALLQSLVIPVLPTVQAGLHTSQNTVTWVLTAYLLSASVFTPIVGRLGDMWGKARMLVIALAVLAVGSFLSAIAGSIDIMILGRVIQGVGGGVMPLAFGIIRDEFPKEKVPGAVGTLAALTAVGAGLGIVFAGPIVDLFNYHWLFWIPAVVVVVAAVAAKIVVPESLVRSGGKINWLAAVLLSGWLVAALVPISEAPTWGWTSGRVLGLFAAALVIAVLWVVVETRSAEPLIDMRMMRLPVVWTANLVAFLFGFGMYSIFAFLPEFVQTPSSAGYGFGLSITGSGLAILPLSVGMFVFGLVSGRLTPKYGGKVIVVVGSVISIVPFFMLIVAHDHLWEPVVAIGVLGIGFGLAFAAMSNLIVEGVPPAQTGVASGMNANIRTLGGSVGAAIMSSIVTSSARADGLPTNAGYTHGFALLTGAAAVCAVAACLVPSARRRASRAEMVAALPHPELGLVAAGTLVGDGPE